MGNRGFDAWPTDGAGWVKAEVDHFGSISNAMAYLHRRLVGAIRETALPVKIEGISYNPAAEPPDAEHMYDESVLIDFAPYDRSYAEPLFESEHPRNVFYDGVHAAWQENGFRGSSSVPVRPTTSSSPRRPKGYLAGLPSTISVRCGAGEDSSGWLRHDAQLNGRVCV
jgi:hypothetical protein